MTQSKVSNKPDHAGMIAFFLQFFFPTANMYISDICCVLYSSYRILTTYLTSSFDVRILDESEASKVAIFATGTHKLFKELDEIIFQLNIHKIEETSPIGNTCTCTVLFPTSFTEYEKFRSHLLKMMTEAVDFLECCDILNGPDNTS